MHVHVLDSVIITSQVTLSLCLVRGLPGSGITSVTSNIIICEVSLQRIISNQPDIWTHFSLALNFLSTHRGRSYDDVLLPSTGSLLAPQLHHLHTHHTIKSSHVEPDRGMIPMLPVKWRYGNVKGLTWHLEWAPRQ